MKFTSNFSGHQGDVQFFSIAEVPASAKKIEKSFFAASEKSGHVHAMCGDYELFESTEAPGHIVRVRSGGVVINHIPKSLISEKYWDVPEVLAKADHHPTINIPEGVYFFGIQRKADPFAGVFKQLSD